MITKFNTSASAATTTSKGGGKSIITFVVVAAAIFAGYKFVLKPYLDKKNEKDG